MAECTIVIDISIIVNAQADSLCSFDEFALVVALS